MTDEIKKKIELHQKWRNNEGGGERADLRGANLSDADLRGADLSDADLRYADLRGANLSYANLSDADLRGADLSYANLSYANLSDADLSDADLRGADLSYANLSGADLSDADLSDADLSGANLSGANLSGANLSGADGLLSAIDYLDANFERTADGYIAYKTFGCLYAPPDKWDIKTGSVITETVNPDRCTECGSGINVAPLEWVRKNYEGDIWRVLIRWAWLPGVIVPHSTYGKIRCERAELVEVVT